MNPMTFEEWKEKNRNLYYYDSQLADIHLGWNARQQEVDELKQENEFLKDRARCAPYENAKFSVMAIRRLEQKNAELEKKLSDAQWDFQEGDIVVKELESRCKQLQGLVDEIAKEFVIGDSRIDCRGILEGSTGEKLLRAASRKQPLQDHIPEVGKMVEKSCETCRHFSYPSYCKSKETGQCCSNDDHGYINWQPKEGK